MKKMIVLTSGGVDSSVLALVMARKGYQVYPVFVRQGFVWENAEIFWLEKLLAVIPADFMPLTILDFSVKDIYGDHWSLSGNKVPGYRSRDEKVYLPGRNLFLISKAAVFGATKGIHEIALGPLSGNPFPDSTRKFFDAMEKTLSLGLGARFKIHAPFLKLTKRKVLAFAGKKFPFALTLSCLKPTSRHRPCGACNKCREKAEAFAKT